MSHNPIWRPDPTKPVRSDVVPPETVPSEWVPDDSDPFASDNLSSENGESDFAELAEKFAVYGGGGVTEEVSRELALDVLLNEIVEQARMATGATGAAIALARGGEMICHASSGANAPELGIRLDLNSGLSGACVRTRKIQCCSDALADPSADAEASRQLGVRSVMALPLLQDQELIGIFEIFSQRPAAFGDRDLQSLDVLARRILKNTRALQSSLVSGAALATASAPPSFVGDAALAGISRTAVSEAAVYHTPISLSTAPKAEQEPGEPDKKNRSGWRLDWLTTVLGGMVLTVVVLMAIVSGTRLGWLKGSARGHASRATTTLSSATPGSPAGREANASPSAGTAQPSLPSNSASSEENSSARGQSAVRANSWRVPDGSLRVYENGKEIFRMTPAGDEATAGSAPEKPGTALSLQPARIVELSPDAAVGSLLRRVEPQYPEGARLQHIQGPVLLDVRIARDGAVQEVKVVSGDRILADAAMTAVRQWRFKPHVVNGSASEMQTRITLKFTLPAN